MSDAHAQAPDAATAPTPPSTGKRPIIQVRNLHKSFGDKPVLRGLNLDIDPSERIAIIGASGSGKSTFLRMLMTLERPTSGEIWIDGEPLWQMPRHDTLVPANEAHIRRVRAKVGMVFQHFNLFPHMTVMGNVIEAPRRVLKMPKDAAVKRATELLESVGLGDKLEAHPAQLSGGQKQRVAIARALAMDPTVMLFDEVTSALDPELVGEVLNVLRDIAKRGETTMLLVTHQMHFAQEIATRVVFVDEGVVCEQGPPSEIFNNPKEQRTRDFLSAVLEAG